MTAIDKITQATYIGSFEDRMSGPADKSRQALDALGNSVEATDTKVTRATGSWDSYVAKAAGASTLSIQIGKAERDLANAVVARDNEIAKGNTTLDRSASTIAALEARLQGLQDRYTAMTRAVAEAFTPTQRLSDTMGDMAAKTVAFAAASRATAEVSSRVAELSAQFNPAIASAQKMASEIALLNEAFHIGADMGGNYQDVLAGIKAKYDGTAQAAKDAAKSQIELNSAIEATKSKYDPVFAAAQRYTTELKAIDAAEASGALNAKLAGEARITAYQNSNQPIQTLTKTIGQHTEATWQSKFATQQFGVQTIQLFTSIQAGTPVLTAFIQQGHQIVDVALSTGTGFGVLASAARAAFAALTGPIGIAITIAGTIAAIGVSAELSARQLANFQNALRATRDDYAALSEAALATAKNIAATTNISTSDAIAAARSISAVPSFSGSQQALSDLIKLANDLAVALGKTVPDAAKELADAMKDPATAAQRLSDAGFKGLNQQLVDQVKLWQAAGDKATAFRLVQDGINASVAGGSKPTTELGSAWERLSKAFTTAGQDGRSLADALGTAITTAAAAAIDAVTGLIKVIEQLRQLAASMIPTSGGKLPGASLGSTSSVVVTPSTALRSDIAQQIYDTAERRNFGGSPELSALQADFATRVAQQESSGLQSAVSPRGAQYGRGIMGLSAGTASDMGVNPVDANENITGGLKYIAQLWAKYGGNPALVAMAFNWGPGNVDAFLDNSKSLADVPPETSKYVKLITGVNVGSISTGRGIAGANAGGLGSGGLPSSVPTVASAIGGPGDIKEQLDAALKYADSLDTIAGKAKALEAEANQLTEALNKPGQSKLTYDKLAEALDIVHGRQYANITATQQVNRELEQQSAIAGQDGAAAQKIADALLHLDQTSLATTGHVASLAEKQALLVSVSHGLSNELANVVTQTGRQITANENSVSAVEKGGKALDDYNASVKAHVDALQFTKKGTEEYNTAVAVLTASNRDLAQSQRDVTAAQDIHGFQQENEQIALEADLIGKSTAQINIQTAALRERQKQGLSAGDIGSAIQNQAVQMAANTAAFRTQVDQQKQDLNELANSFTSAFDTISQAMVNSFLSGSGAAVNWGNVMRSVVQQVLAEFLKLAILNPLLNSLFGGSRSELGGVLGAVLGGDGGGGINILGLGQQAIGLGDTASGGQLSGGLLSRLGVGSFLNQGLFGTSTIEAASTLNAGTLGIGGVGGTGFLGAGGSTITSADIGLLAPAESTGILGGASIGSLAGGIGAGFGLGSLAGGALQRSTGKVGPGPQIGAATGAVAGAAIGSIIPGIGTLIGAIIGGIIGGGGGGLIGPKAPSPYSQTVVGVTQGGRLDIGVTNSQLVDATAERKQAIADISKINAALDATGLMISDIVENNGPNRHLSVPSGDINALQVGQNSPKGTPDPSKINDLQSGFWKLRFSSQDSNLNEFLQRGGGRGFHSSDELATTVTAIKSFIAATSGTDFASHISATLAQAGQLENVNIAGFLAPIQKFVTETVPALLNVGKVSGSLADAIAGLHAQFDGAIATAHQLGYKEQELTAARDKGIQAALDTATSTVWGPGGIVQALFQRQRQAQATLSGSPTDALNASLSAFDNQAAVQRTQLHDQLVGIYGDSVTTSAWYAGLQAQLEATLGQERLVIQKQANSALVSDAQSAANAFSLTIAEMQLNVRRETARLAIGVNGPNPYIPEANGGNITQKSLALYEFDQVTAPQQREQFKQQLIGWFGDAYKTTADFGAKMNDLETTLGVERLAVAQKYDDQILQTVSGTVTSLTDYAHSLQTSQASPLSPLAQYDLAQSQFNAVSGAAKAGDYNSVQKLQSYSEALLNASRAVFGSGAGYASDFEKVLDALNLVAQATPDSLTASVYTAETRTQTQVLSDGQTALAGLLQSILTELQQGSSRPARAA